MALTLINNSRAVVTQIGANPNGTGAFTITAGSLPLSSGQTLTADNTIITNNIFSYFGSPEGRIYMFLSKGDAQIDLYINNNIVSSTDCSSGWATIECPILTSTDTFEIRLIAASAPVPSQTPTPSVTASVTPTPTGTPSVTSTPTPSSTLPAAQYKLDSVYNYPQDDTTVVTANTQFFYAKVGNNPFVLLSTAGVIANLNNTFSGTGFVEVSTGTTIDVILSANPQSGYYLTSYGGNGPWDEMRLTGFTWNGTNRWTGTTRFYSGGTQVYTETGGFVQLNSSTKTYSIGGTFGSYPDTGYFYVMPTP